MCRAAAQREVTVWFNGDVAEVRLFIRAVRNITLRFASKFLKSGDTPFLIWISDRRAMSYSPHLLLQDMPWEFKPTQDCVRVRPGQSTLVFFTARNKTDKPITGYSVYNVTPDKAAVYFNKIQVTPPKPRLFLFHIFLA